MSAVRFLAPPPGLHPLELFALDAVDGAPGLYTLRAADDPGVRLFVVDAGVYLPAYTPTVDERVVAELGATSPDELAVLAVVTVHDDGPAANLLAPVLVHRDTGVAAQVILDDRAWPLRAPLAA